MSRHTTHSQTVGKIDPVWDRIRREAEEVARAEPALGGFIYSSILSHESFEDALVHRLAARLGNADLGPDFVIHAFEDALEAEPEIGFAARCSTSKAIRPSRPIALHTASGTWAARTSPTTFRAVLR